MKILAEIDGGRIILKRFAVWDAEDISNQYSSDKEICDL